MKKLHASQFVEWRDCTRFLTSCLAVYGLSNGRLELTDSGDFLVFYDRQFLSERKWSVIPLWEGDFRVLLMEQDKELKLTEIIREYCLKRGIRSLYRATVERSRAPYEISGSNESITGKDIAVTIATHRLDPETTNLEELFEVTDTYIPYWGHNFIWPSDESLLLYTNGDNAAFIAGNRQEVESMLGVKYEYCLSRFVAANVLHPGWIKLILSYKEFCQEFT